jgi:prepilin-type processing-associated H-X9-DG protein
MDQDLLGYLLNALEPHEHKRVAAYLRAHPEAQARLEALRSTLEPLKWDPPETPPADLSARTLAKLVPLPLAATKAASWGFRPSRRMIEVAVAASVLLAAVGVLTAWVGQLNDQQPNGKPNPLHLIECKYNLQKIYTSGLRPYCDYHGQFPSVATAAAQPYNIAGLVYPVLWDARLLPADISIRCPGAVGLGLAYSLGYLVKGEVAGLRLQADSNSLLPLMADSAPLNAAMGNSPHHGGHGQNVLYCDGHVTFFTTRNAGIEQDDIYVNRAGKVAAGLDWKDTVLSSSLATP